MYKMSKLIYNVSDWKNIPLDEDSFWKFLFAATNQVSCVRFCKSPFDEMKRNKWQTRHKFTTSKVKTNS